MVRIGPVLFGLYLLGMLCLPIASFERYRELPDPSVPVLGNALAFENPWNRGAILGGFAMTVAWLVLAMTMKRRPTIQSLSVWDASVAAWIAAPAVTGLFNPSPIRDDLWQSLYLAIAWGGPYLVGRVLISSDEDLRRSLWVLMLVGAITLIPAIIEFVVGRFLYRDLYGYHPFQSIGESRWFGYRPLLFFEDPNQIAMWWMTVAITAMALIPAWFSVSRMTGLKWIAMGLPFLFQGVGAAVLTVVGAVAMNVRRITSWKYWLGGAIVLGAVLFMARGPVLRFTREMARQTGIEEVAKNVLRGSDLGSFSWRLAREEEGSNLWQQHPITGWGTVMFWREAGQAERPWGMFSLVTGAYGLVGSGCLLVLFFGPLLACMLSSSIRSDRHLDRSETDAAVNLGVPILIALHGMDAVMNSAFFLPMMWLYGAWVSQDKARGSLKGEV